MPIGYCEASAEDIPLDANSVDTVVITYTLCTVPNPAQALVEVARVLRPGGLVGGGTRAGSGCVGGEMAASIGRALG